MPEPFAWRTYSNHTMVSGRTLGHSGWGGQCAIANLDTGIFGVFLSVIENEHATNRNYLGPLIRMLESIANGEPQGFLGLGEAVPSLSGSGIPSIGAEIDRIGQRLRAEGRL